MIVTPATQRLAYLCSCVPTILSELDQDTWVEKPFPEKWSKLEILGHLVDSAIHNHQRLVRAHMEDVPMIIYDQDPWVYQNRYQLASAEHLIAFWSVYNQHLLHLVQTMPAASWSLRCKVGTSEVLTLENIFINYLTHLEHHLHQIISYE